VRYFTRMQAEAGGPGAQRQRQGFGGPVVALALVLLAGLAAFAIYAGLWRNGDSSASDPKRAVVYAQELLAAQCTTNHAPCRTKSLTEVLPGIWRVRTTFGDGSERCSDIKLDTFRPTGTSTWPGVAPC
jgi:hypothetical protein